MMNRQGDTEPREDGETKRRTRRLLDLLVRVSGCLVVLLVASFARGAERSLLADSTSARLWLAEIVPPADGESHRTTIIYTRPMQETAWQRTASIPAVALGIHDIQGELAVLLADGTWRLVRPAGLSQEADQRMGQRPPGPIRAMAVEGRTVWAICMVSGGLEAAKAPAATQPVLRAGPRAEVPSSPVLFALDKGLWRAVADVPADISPGGPATCATLTVIDGVATIAVSPLGRSVRVHRLSADGKWRRQTLPELPSEARFLQIIRRNGEPALCAIGPGQWMTYRLVAGASMPEESSDTAATTQAGASAAFTVLAPLSVMPPPTGVAVVGTSASDLRVIFRPSDSRMLMERLYDPAGQPTSSVLKLAIPSGPSPTSRIQNLPTMLTVAMMLIFLSSLRRRPTPEQVQYILRRVRPAPMLRRSVAGVIDLAPAIVGTLLTMWSMAQDGRTDAAAPDILELAADPFAAGGIALYLLHTTLVEVLAGRTIGKMLLGLHVVATDGSPAGRTALLTRNLLRLVDVILFPPLVLLAGFSPVHQRLADVVAGTLVVVCGKPERPEDETPVESDTENEAREE